MLSSVTAVLSNVQGAQNPQQLDRFVSWQVMATLLQNTAHEEQLHTDNCSLRIRQSHAHWSALTMQHGITAADVQCSKKACSVRQAHEQPVGLRGVGSRKNPINNKG